jgi:hypothetical protein
VFPPLRALPLKATTFNLPSVLYIEHGPFVMGRYPLCNTTVIGISVTLERLALESDHPLQNISPPGHGNRIGSRPEGHILPGVESMATVQTDSIGPFLKGYKTAKPGDDGSRRRICKL